MNDKSNKILVTVTGKVGVGKSALCDQIEKLCHAMALPVHWVNGAEERNLVSDESFALLEEITPSITIVEEIEREHHTPLGVDSDLVRNADRYLTSLSQEERDVILRESALQVLAAMSQEQRVSTCREALKADGCEFDIFVPKK